MTTSDRLRGVARMLVAGPHLHQIDCAGKVQDSDARVELYGTGALPSKYETALEKYFRTTNKRRLLALSHRSRFVPSLFGADVYLVDRDSRMCVRKIV